MNNKQEKKIRKEARKLYTTDVKKIVKSQALDQALSNFIKPKPMFWPRWFYAFMLKKLLNTGKK